MTTNCDDPKYQYDRHGTKGARVGQAILDLADKPYEEMSCQEMLEGIAPKFAEDLEKCVNDSLKKYKSPFYVLVLTRKEMYALNVIRNYFIARQTAPYASKLMVEYPNYTKTLYVVRSDHGDIKVAWSLPGVQDCQEVAKTPDNFPDELVGWIRQCFSGKLDKDEYNELFR
jgi:hypothetical protein